MKTHKGKLVEDPTLEDIDKNVAPGPTLRPVPVPGLVVTAANDPAESAADSLADSALGRLGEGGATDSTHHQQRSIPSLVRPSSAAAGSSASTPHPVSPLSRLARTDAPGPDAVAGPEGGPLDLATDTAVRSRLGGGSGLVKPVRARLEAGFGVPLGHVRVHEGAAAASLNDAVTAKAFTVGNDIFLGRDVAPATPGGEKILAHEVAHVLAGSASQRLHRWYQPTEKSVMPLSTSPPRGKGQPSGIFWEEIKEDPRGDVHRFIDSAGNGWEAPGPKQPWKQTDWHREKEKAKQQAQVWWYDSTLSKWTKGKLPDAYREAMPDERPAAIAQQMATKGYDSADKVPVYVKSKFRPKADSKKTKRDRGPELRALDRTARLLKTDMPETGTPHLATSVVGGSMQVAGNTGSRHVSKGESEEANSNLSNALNPARPLPYKRRAKKDALKLRALQSGDYGAHHKRAAPGLSGVSSALDNPPQWDNVGAGGGAAEHGEMTVLAKIHQELQANPNPNPGRKIQKDLGGVKLACGACQLAIEAYNEFLGGPLGYSIKVAGTHHGFFPGWQAPDFILKNAEALEHVKAGLPKGSYLTPEGVLAGVNDVESDYQDPEESESEWEEV